MGNIRGWGTQNSKPVPVPHS